jgi:hypothetical protein
VQRVEELIRAERRITINSVATALRCSHGSAYSIMHYHLKLRKVCARWVPRELKNREKVNITYGMQMKEKICLTGLLLGTNHGCITTNPNKSVLQCNGNIPVHLRPKSSKFTPSAGKVMLTVFCDSQGVLLANFQKRGENVISTSYCVVLLKLRDAIRRKLPGHLATGLLHYDNARPHTARAFM